MVLDTLAALYILHNSVTEILEADMYCLLSACITARQKGTGTDFFSSLPEMLIHGLYYLASTTWHVLPGKQVFNGKYNLAGTWQIPV